MSLTILHALIVSVSIGALIGLIRQWADLKDTQKEEPIAGLRTYSLWSLLGFLSAYIHTDWVDYFFPVAFAVFGAVLIVSNFIDQRSSHAIGLTSYSVAVLTFIAGALVFWDQYQISIAIAATMGILIASKPFVHSWTRRLNDQDIRSLLQFLAVTGIVLPLVPDQGFGPLEAFNPYSIWLMVVLISGLGFVGYVAMRFLGTRAGISVTGFVGGLASSTATTLALTRSSRDTPELGKTFAIGIVLANTIMIGRVAVIILALNRPLFQAILPAIFIMATPTIIFLLWRIYFSGKREEEINLPEISNPLSLKLAIKFALLYAIIVFLVKAAGEWGDGAGFYPVAFLSGLTDMDAIALSLTNTHKEGELAITLAARGIMLGAVANSIFKTGFAISLGNSSLRGPILLGMIPMIIAGIASIFIL